MNTSTPCKPDSYLVWAILTTLFCCLPFGIVAIIRATQVDTYWAHGKYEEARLASDSAKKWIIASVVSVAVICGLYIAMIVIIGVAASTFAYS